MDQKEVIEPQQTTAGAPVEEPFIAATETLSPEQITELREKAGKVDQLYEQLLRTAADLENFKKRAAREKQEAIKFANESLLEKLLPILDNFEMALTAAGAQNTSVDALRSGVQMIAQQLKTALTEAGLQEIDAAGKPFDPNFHEAISQQESTHAPEGTVVQQTRKGYRLRERLLRPASVVVAKKPAA
jgi:molecular chaperone GrpE